MTAETKNSGITRLLADWRDGSADALERLMPLVYGELRRIASFHLRVERAQHTLQPTALVHETYLRLAADCRVEWEGRSHFFGIARRVMRQVLIQYSRLRSAEKRGGGRGALPLEQAGEVPDGLTGCYEDLTSALTELAAADPRKARIVLLRYFDGFTNEEVAAELGVSLSTVEREVRMALPWLRSRLEPAV
jgi:RNA polymerase sigma factor (TIGR02999 family)